MGNTINSWLRRLLILWTVLLSILMSNGVMTKAHIGSITFGPTTDIWAMSIAISSIKYGLHGGIGYRVISNELAKYLTANGDALSLANPTVTAALDDKPENVTRAITAALALPKNINSHNTTKVNDYFHTDFVTTISEDIGYADFYNIAFRLFGFNAFSTHYMYFTLLLSSLIIYLIAFYRNAPAIILIALLTSSFFLVSSSELTFSISTPSFASNRFLGTLALFPLSHCLAYLCISDRQNRIDQFYLVLQGFLLAFTLNLRSSSSWMIVGYSIVLIAIAFIHYYYFTSTGRSIKARLKNMFKLDTMKPIKTSFVILVTILTLYDVSRYIVLHEAYHGDDIMPKHMRWHSAYMALTLHPDWKNKIPRPELVGLDGDGLVWKLYSIYMEHDPKNYKLSTLSNGYKIRTHEKIVRNEFISFMRHNPGYIFELYFRYKPYFISLPIRAMLYGVAPKALLFSMVGLMTAVVLAMNTIRRTQALKIIAITVIIWFVSFLPVIWAYPANYVMGDQFIMTILLITVLFSMVIPICKGNTN